MANDIFYATGRRKRSVARVWIFIGQKGFTINGKEPLDYLKRENLQMIVEQPLKTSRLSTQFRIRADVQGGGACRSGGGRTSWYLQSPCSV